MELDPTAAEIPAELAGLYLRQNKVQEAIQKMDRLADLPLRWHLVGHLQSNKARKAGERFDMIHTVDGAELGLALERAALAANRGMEVLVNALAEVIPNVHLKTRVEELTHDSGIWRLKTASGETCCVC